MRMEKKTLSGIYCRFLIKENIGCWNGYPGACRDNRNGFAFLHDKEYPFEENYNENSDTVIYIS